MTVLGVHPARLDLVVHPGDPVDFTVPVLDADAAVVDASSWTVAATASDVNGTVLHNFTVTASTTSIRVTATTAQTRAWAWSGYAARLVVTATPPTEATLEIAVGWIRLYRP